MKKFVLLSFFVFLGLIAFGQQADAIVGKWLNSSKEAHIQIYKKNNKYFGKLAWLKEPNDDDGKPKKDVNNPSRDLRNSSLLGLEILRNFQFVDGVWEDGTIYDPRTGKTYSCKITLSGNKLNVRGFVGISLIGKTDVWTRIN
ncbi:DUF2147 domain-containing protein [Pseudoxanthomonas sp. SGD-10]|nr:DUF2147 domain-containing protein [Pseudoxanthomonas sp. SGD-10]